MGLPRVLVVVVASISLPGCYGAQPTTRGVLHVAHHVGGMHYRTIVHGGVWYQTIGPRLLAIDVADGQVLSCLELATVGESGPAVDMAIERQRAVAVLEDDAVVELDLTDARRPQIVRRRGADELGIEPARVGVAAGEFYVSGTGGVVRWSDGRIVLSGPHRYGRVVGGAAGVLVCAGRRVYRLKDGGYVGSASDLQPLPGAFGQPGLLVFSREGPETSVGLMTPNVREVDAYAATVSVEGTVRRVRATAGRIWVVTERNITGYAVGEGRLHDPRQLALSGVWDLDALDLSRLAVAGSMGRAIVALDGKRPRIEMLAQPPNEIRRATSDGRFVLAGGPDGAWQYEVFASARPSAQPTEDLPEAPDGVAAVAGSAHIVGDRRSVVIATGAGRRTVSEPCGAEIHCVASTGAVLWIGHDRGITVHAFADGHGGQPIGTLRLDGPVRYLFPVGALACAYAGAGGLGVAELTQGRD